MTPQSAGNMVCSQHSQLGSFSPGQFSSSGGAQRGLLVVGLMQIAKKSHQLVQKCSLRVSGPSQMWSSPLYAAAGLTVLDANQSVLVSPKSWASLTSTKTELPQPGECSMPWTHPASPALRKTSLEPRHGG